ncbi:MAG: ligase [Acidimicrobiia bacterium]|nr:ligase [Acidimicrobiia bacterium]
MSALSRPRLPIHRRRPEGHPKSVGVFMWRPSRQRRSIRTAAAVLAGAVAAGASRRLGFGHGAAIGGKVALTIDPHALRHLAHGRPVVIVSGTNGKSTTTRMTAQALRTDRTVASTRGANLPGGLLDAVASDADEIVLEVDELYVSRILHETRASVLVLLNLTRDQLDRVNELARIAKGWRESIALVDWPLRIIANANDPWIAWSVADHKDVVWVAGNRRWTDDTTLCPSCGRLLHQQADDRCQFAMGTPRPGWVVDLDHIITPDQRNLSAELAVPGDFNVDNAAMAMAVATHRGIDAVVALDAIRKVTSIDGRYRSVQYGRHRLQLFLAKNPASWAEMLGLLETSDTPAVICVNARGPDGRDPSWLWDVRFEKLGDRPVVAAGDRRLDLALRLEIAGVNYVIANDPLSGLEALPEGDVAVLCTYTAFHELVDVLGVEW